MKTALFILCVILLLSIAGNVWQWSGSRNRDNARLSENSRLEDTVRVKTAAIRTRDRLIFTKDSLRLADSLKFSRVSEGLKQANSGLVRKIAALRPLILPDLLENDTLEAFVMAQDSLIASQDSLYRAQEIFCQLQVSDLRDIIRLTNEKYEAQEAITAVREEQLAASQAQTEDERRGKKFRNFIIYGLIGLIAFQAATR